MTTPSLILLGFKQWSHDWFLSYTPLPINQKIVLALCSNYIQKFYRCHPGLSCNDQSSLAHVLFSSLLISWLLPLPTLGYFSPSNQSYHFSTEVRPCHSFLLNPPMASQFTQGKSQTPDGFQVFTWSSAFSPDSFHASPAGFLAAPQTHQDCSWLKFLSSGMLFLSSAHSLLPHVLRAWLQYHFSVSPSLITYLK